MLRTYGIGTRSMTALALAAALLAGCSTKSQSKTDDGKTDSVAEKSARKTKTSKLTPFVPPKEVTLKEASPAQLKELIAKHKGQAVLVDYWAYWCEPCKRAFPHTVALSEKYAKQGLVVVSVCMDGRERRQKALDFLKSMKATIINFASSLDEDVAYDAFDIDNASIPHYKIFDADGRLVDKVTGADDERIDKAVRRALGIQ